MYKSYEIIKNHNFLKSDRRGVLVHQNQCGRVLNEK
jgi:hypothetical protein